jgi:signal transduction histidine kinase
VGGAASGAARDVERVFPGVAAMSLCHTGGMTQSAAPAARRPAPAVGDAAIGIVVVAVCFTLSGLQVAQYGLAAVWVETAALWALLAAAAVVWREPSHRRSALLLAAAAVAMSVSALDGLSVAGGGYWGMVGWLAFWWSVVALLPLFLIYPSPGFETRGAARLCWILVGVVALRFLWAPLWDPAFAPGGAQGTPWLTYPWASEDRLYAAQHAEAAAIAALMPVAVVLLVGRWRRASGPSRRATRAVAAAGVILALGVLVLGVVGTGTVGGASFDGVRRVVLLLLAATPVVVLVVAVSVSRRRALLVRALIGASGDVSSVEQTLRSALDDDDLRLYLRVAGGWVDSSGRHVATGSDDPPAPSPLRERRTIVVSDGRPSVAVDLTTPTPAEREAVDFVVSAASLALENSRLALERQAHLAELHASRSRIVEAGLAERRRLERDLHDGVQQHLLAVSATLTRAELAGDEEVRGAALADAKEKVADAMSEVRAVGRGIHPTVLSQGGLPVALPRLESVDQRVVVEVGPELAQSPRLDPDVETAIYFTAAELVTNAVRHSCASRIHVVAELTSAAVPPRRADGIRLLVDDDSGAEAVVEGVVGVRDRAEALEGDVMVSHVSGHVVIEVWIPLSGIATGGA